MVVMSYIKCENLILGYEDGIVAENINFEVNKGDYLCIVGENGAGKSTLMKTLLHLVPPVGGRFEMGDGLIASQIGYLPQQTVVQRDFPASVWEIVLSGTLSEMGFRPFYSGREKKRARQNMERMDILHLKNECYRNLSGGQQQRVLLARALCATSRLLVLDEPVTGLDPKAAQEFYQLIKKLNDEGITIIMVSHDVQTAIAYASHILHVERDNSFVMTREEYLKSSYWRQLTGTGNDSGETAE